MVLNVSLAASSCSFTRLCAPLFGWSTLVRQVALTYTAPIIVALAAQQAGRPDLIRSRHSRFSSYLGGIRVMKCPLLLTISLRNSWDKAFQALYYVHNIVYNTAKTGRYVAQGIFAV